MRALASLLALTVVALPSAAFAHTGHGDTAGILHGFMHPIGGIDHILAMVAVGVFAFVLGGRALWLVPLSFVGMMMVGFLLGLGAVELPFVELGIAALGRPMPVIGAIAIVGVFAVFHGHAHGAEMPADASGLTYALGFVAATALLHVAGIVGAVGVARLAGKYGKAVAQVAGGVFALGGIGVLAGWL